MASSGGSLSAASVYGQRATLVCLEVPPSTSFGIDLSQWIIGAGFVGLKGVPAGFHAVHTAPATEGARSTSLWWAAPGDIHVLRWDKEIEGLSPVDESTTAAVVNGVRRLELDGSLGLYPPDDAARWRELTCHVSEPLVRRVGPVGGTVLLDNAAEPSAREWRQAERAVAAATSPAGGSAPSGVPAQDDLAAFAGLRSIPSCTGTVVEAGPAPSKVGADGGGICASLTTPLAPGAASSIKSALPPQQLSAEPSRTVAGSAEPLARAPSLFFSPLADLRTMTPAALSAFAVDTSAALLAALALHAPAPAHSSAAAAAHDILVGELQLAFALACGGQSLQAFEAWKVRADVVCRAEDALLQGAAELASLPASVLVASLDALEVQLRALPPDFIEHGGGGSGTAGAPPPLTAASPSGFLPAALATLSRTLTRQSTRERVPGAIRAAARRLLDTAASIWGPAVLAVQASCDLPSEAVLLRGPSTAAVASSAPLLQQPQQLRALLAALEDDADGGDMPTIVE